MQMVCYLKLIKNSIPIWNSSQVITGGTIYLLSHGLRFLVNFIMRSVFLLTEYQKDHTGGDQRPAHHGEVPLRLESKEGQS